MPEEGIAIDRANGPTWLEGEALEGKSIILTIVEKLQSMPLRSNLTEGNRVYTVTCFKRTVRQESIGNASCPRYSRTETRVEEISLY